MDAADDTRLDDDRLVDRRVGERRPAAPSYSRFLLHPPFVSVGGSLLIAAFGSDYMYSSNGLMQWANASAWLIAIGLVLALVGAIALVIDLVTGRGPIRWLDFILLAVAAIISLVNEFVHTRDAWTSVVPLGISLSGISAVLLIIEAFRGWSAIGWPLARDREVVRDRVYTPDPDVRDRDVAREGDIA